MGGRNHRPGLTGDTRTHSQRPQRPRCPRTRAGLPKHFRSRGTPRGTRYSRCPHWGPDLGVLSLLLCPRCPGPVLAILSSLFGDVTAALREHILATLDEHCGHFAPVRPRAALSRAAHGREPGDARRLRRDPRDEGRPGAALPCQLLSVTSGGGATLTKPPFGAAAGISSTSR